MPVILSWFLISSSGLSQWFRFGEVGTDMCRDRTRHQKDVMMPLPQAGIQRPCSLGKRPPGYWFSDFTVSLDALTHDLYTAAPILDCTPSHLRICESIYPSMHPLMPQTPLGTCYVPGTVCCWTHINKINGRLI